MQTGGFCVLTAAEFEVGALCKLGIQMLGLLAVLRQFTVVDLLFIVTLVACGGSLLGPCFVVQGLVSFLVVKQSSLWERKSCMLPIHSLPDVVWLLLFCASPSQCLGRF